MLLTNRHSARKWAKKNAGKQLPTPIIQNRNNKEGNKNTERERLAGEIISQRHNGFLLCRISLFSKDTRKREKMQDGILPKQYGGFCMDACPFSQTKGGRMYNLHNGIVKK